MDGDHGQRRYVDARRPIIPSLLYDGEIVPLHHPAQIASVLGTPSPGASPLRRVAWDTVTILEDWLELLRPTPWETIMSPTPYRGRSIRNLTVNVFRPFAMLPMSWASHRFEWWGGEEDVRQEELLPDKASLETFAVTICTNWHSFLLDVTEDITASDPLIRSNRGDVAYSTLLETHRFHAANHHRQIVHFLADEGVDVSQRLRTETFSDIGLSEVVYERTR